MNKSRTRWAMWDDRVALNEYRILQLARAVAKSTTFNMENCGTCFISEGAKLTNTRVRDFHSNHLAKWLGIGDEERQDLCFGLSYPGTLHSITRKHAAAVLRRLAKTGKVDWGKP